MEDLMKGFDGWITGWRRIARYLGVSIRTAKRYHYKYSMPVLRRPGDHPVIITYMVDMWLIKYDEIKRKKKKYNDSAQI